MTHEDFFSAMAVISALLDKTLIASLGIALGWNLGKRKDPSNG